MTKIVIVEDLPIHQEYLASIIDREESLQLLDVIGTGKEAIFRIPSLNPDIVIMDIGLPDISGIECIKHLISKIPTLLILVLTIFEDDSNVFESLAAGAKGYILKKNKAQKITESINDLLEGGASISSTIALKIINRLPHKKEAASSKEYNISKKEAEILHHLANGHSYEEVATLSNITVKTLKTHIYRIYNKLNADNRTEALNRYFGRE